MKNPVAAFHDLAAARRLSGAFAAAAIFSAGLIVTGIAQILS